jgi:hypothetical protein
MDRYQLGLIAQQVAHNLQRVYELLNDPHSFPTNAQTDENKDLAKMKATLEAVANSQARSLNLLTGTYETAALYDLLSLGNNTAGALGQASIPDKDMELGDPVFSSPGYSPPPTTASQPQGSLFATTPVGRISTAVAISQRITGIIEDHVADAVMPGVNRCKANIQVGR